MATKEERNQGIDMQQAFSVLPNQILLDNRLKNESKIIWTYIQGKPKDWDFSAYRIAKQLNLSEKTIRKYLIELEEFGYLVRNRQCTGRVEYFLYCPPNNEPSGNNYLVDEKPTGKKAPQQKSLAEDFTAISNKDVLVIKKDTNKEVIPLETTNKFFNMVLEDSEELDRYIASLHIPPLLARIEIRKFVSYWTELNSTGKKQRWQMEKTFEVPRRLRTWFSNVKGFNANKITNKYTVDTV